MISLLTLSACAVTGAGAAIWLDARDDDRTCGASLGRSRPLLVGLLGALVAVMVMLAMLRSTRLDWDAARLSHSAALLLDGHFYAAPHSGVVLGTYYGPVSTLFFAPLAAIRSPSWGVLFASGSAALAFIAPLCLYLATATDAKGARVPMAAAFLLGASATPPLAAVFTQVHADAPALGFGLLACILVSQAGAAAALPRRFLLAGVAAALSVAAKQTMLPLVLALLLWIAFHYRRRAVRAYVAGGASTLFLLVGLVGWRDGVDAPLYHAARLVLAFPVDHSLPAVRTVAWALACALFVPVAILLLRHRGPSARDEWPIPADHRLFLWVALAGLPSALLGALKYGGYVNTLAPCVLPGWYAALAMLARRSARAERRCLLIAGTLALSLLCVAQPAWSAYANSQALPLTNMGLASTHERAHPGETWFPMNPLVAAVHRGTIEHFGPAVYERLLAGDPVGETQWKAFLPQRMKRACWPPENNPATDEGIAYILRRLGAVTIERVPDLPGWYCVRR